MSNSPEETRYSEQPDAPKLPVPYESHADSSSDDDEFARLIVQMRTPFPATMLATGILWIVAGAAYLGLFSLLRLVGTPFQVNDIWLILGAFFFIKDGIQLIRGKFRDPQIDGIFSVLLGLFFLGNGWYQYAETEGIGSLLFGTFFGLVFLAPGISVYFGRRRYLDWKNEQESWGE